MAGLPAHCANCGLVFESAFLNVTNSESVTFQNIAVSCPRCGGMAKAIDGTFDFVGNTIKVHPGAPPRTVAILKVLQTALREAEAGAEDKAVKTIAEKSPALAKE